MPTSEARIRANQLNAQLSTGPKTAEGKERSRRNGLKHGLSGAGIVVLEEVSAEVERRNDELQAELAPRSAMGKILVRDLATLSVRMERSATQETAAIAARVRNAAEEFDQDRLDQAGRLMDLLGEEPRAHLRKLRKSPEGVELLIQAWQELRGSLTGEPKPIWTAWHRERAENLNGRRIEESGGSRIGALSNAIWGDFSGLKDDEGVDLDEERRQAWARRRMVERIDEEVAKLEAHYETLDFETIDLDRAQAPARALFDPSRPATLARRYESEARRGFYKALKEYRQAEAEAAGRPTPAATPCPPEDSTSLASSRDRSDRAPREPRPLPEPSPVEADEPSVGAVGSLESPGWDGPGSA